MYYLCEKYSYGMNYDTSDIIEYTVMLISEFATKFRLTDTEAYHYMSNHKGIAFVTENYGALHTLDFNEAVDCVAQLCRRNGGGL